MMAPTQQRKADQGPNSSIGASSAGDLAKHAEIEEEHAQSLEEHSDIGPWAGTEQIVSDSEDEERASELENENKRHKTAIYAIVKEYVCPLSLELPVEPVIAEDGRVYNRADITKHIKNSKKDKDKNLRSPVTNENMGPKLVPAVQVQNMIRALVESGTVDDTFVDQWKKVDETRSKAANGDPQAMSDLSVWHFDGSNGLVEDDVTSYSWAKKAADLGDAGAKANVGFMLYKGYGVDRDPTEAVLTLGIAAGMGSPQAALYLARMYHKVDDDDGSFAKDDDKARHWLNKALGNFGENVKGQKMAEDLQKLLDEEKEETNGN